MVAQLPLLIWTQVRGAADRWRVVSSGDEASLGERIAASVRAIEAIGLPNLLCSVALCAYYAVKLGQYWLLLTPLLMLLTVTGSLLLLPGARFARVHYPTPRSAQTALVLYAVAIGITWYVTLSAIASAPIGDDRIGIACVNVAVICAGGLIFALTPRAAIWFMAIVGLRLSIALAPLVAFPGLYIVAIVMFMAILATMFVGQAELFAATARAATELRMLEARRAAEEAAAVEERHALVEAAHQRREAERADAERIRRSTMKAQGEHFDRSVLAVVDGLGKVVADLADSTERLTQAGQETRHRARAVASRAVTVGGSMAVARAATDRMRAAIAGIDREVDGQVRAASTAEASAERAREHARILADHSRTVSGIVQTIETIASRTNNLALNALIEAARSGETGRGFAVVAGEVKMLAMQTREAAARIDKTIADMDRAAADVADSIVAIGDDVTRIAGGAGDIAAAIVQQRDATREIGTSVENASSGADEVGVDLREMATQAEIAVELAESLRQLSRAIEAQSTDLGATAASFSAQLKNG